MNSTEIHSYISKLSLDPQQKSRLAFLSGQAYALEVLHDAFVKNGMNENSSIFYQAAKEIEERFHVIAEDRNDLGMLADYFQNLHAVFSSQVNLKESRISYLD